MFDPRVTRLLGSAVETAAAVIRLTDEPQFTRDIFIALLDDALKPDEETALARARIFIESARAQSLS